ncbi:MAG: hypothetical protein E7490_10785 [Ruminococcaceae bacterium]|nr:hypothetical protein [Oscillospiraceae bacterium]
MKGLIYKDIAAIRSQLIGTLIIIAFVYFGFFVMGGGKVIFAGNPLSDAEKFTVTMALNVGTFVGIVCFSPLSINNILEDKQSGWIKYCRCSPLKRGSYSKAKIISTIIIISIYLIEAIIANLVTVVVCGCSIELAFAVPLVFATFTATLMLPTVPLIQRFGRIIEFIYLVLVLVFAIVLGLITNGAMESNGAETALRIISYGVVPVLAIVSGIVSLSISKKMEENDM